MTDRIPYRLPFGTGAVADPPDARDHVARAVAPVPERTVSHRHPVPRGNQGSEGTCVGWATAWAKAWYDWRQRHEYAAFSPRDIYAACKKVDNYPGEATYPRLAVKLLHERGVAPESDWPYKPYQGNTPPAGVDLAARALPQKVAGYAAVTGVDDAIQVLLLHGPFVALVPIGYGWFTAEAKRTGIVDPNLPVQQNLHCVEVLGYDAERALFEAGGSYGPDFGDAGHHWFHREWFALHMSSAWMVYDDTAIDANLVIEVPTPEPEPEPEPTPDPPKPRSRCGRDTSCRNHDDCPEGCRCVVLKNGKRGCRR